MTDTNNLGQVKPGTRVRIIDLIGGRSRNSRLLDMGITPGTEVTVTAIHPFQGPVVVDISGAKIAIGRRIAHNIKVVGVDSQ